MRLGYVLKKFPRISETFILNEILALQRLGAEVTIFSLHTPDDGAFHRGVADLSGPVVYLPERDSGDLLSRLRAAPDSWAAIAPRFTAALGDLVATNRPDAWTVLASALEIASHARSRGIEHLHAHFATVAAWTARTAASFADLPFSFTCHAKDIYSANVDAKHFTRLADPARFVVTVCEANRDYLRERLLTTSSTEIVTLYNGIDLQLFHPDVPTVEREPLVLGVGRLVPKKGFRYLIEAMAHLRREGSSVRCVIVGEGEERAALEQLIRTHGLTGVDLLGVRTQDEVRAWMSRATAFVLPCVVDQDGNRDALPTVLLEALASGVPAISTDVAGVGEIVDRGSAGMLVPQRDVRALATALQRLLADEPLRTTLAARGRERAEQFFDLRSNASRLLGTFAAERGCMVRNP